MTFKLNADVSSYQPDTVAYMKDLKNKGVSSITTKITESTNYKNPKRINQMNSANSVGMVSHYYHFAWFANDENKAVKEGDYFVDTMKKDGCSTGAVAFLDFEETDLKANMDCTQAVITFFRVLVNRGYKRVGFYTYLSFMNHVNWNTIKKEVMKMGAKDCYLWIARYGTTQPGMNGVDIWQYSDKFYGMNQDISYDFKGVLVKEDNSKPVVPHQDKPQPKDSKFKLGQFVKVNSKATNFVNGEKIPDFVKKETLQVCGTPVDKNGFQYPVWLEGVKLGELKEGDLVDGK